MFMVWKCFGDELPCSRFPPSTVTPGWTFLWVGFLSPKAGQLLKLLRALSLSRIFVDVSLNPVYATMVGENFQMNDVQITGEGICESRN